MRAEKRRIVIVATATIALVLILVLIAAVVGKDGNPPEDLSVDIARLSEELEVSEEDNVSQEDDRKQETVASESHEQGSDTETDKSSVESSETIKNANDSQTAQIEAEGSSSESSATQKESASTDSSVPSSENEEVGEPEASPSEEEESKEPEGSEGPEEPVEPESSPAGEGESREPESSPSEDRENSSSEADTPVQEPEEQYAQIAGGKITCDSFGRFSGQYVEDGRDELVESVAAVLITNRSNEYLEYATLTFDIDGAGANFIVTGLPAGASAWVLEAGKLVIVSGADFIYQDCVSSFRDDIIVSSDKIALKADGNMLTATNTSSETLKNVVVYYRVLHTDGNYLGGITYTANFDTLEPGASTEVLAGHYSADDCEVVRVSWEN